MFILFGFGKQTARIYGEVPAQYCGRCHNPVSRRLTKVTTWFTLFFIPVFPYRSRYLLICPICGGAQELSREEFEEMVNGAGLGERGPSRGGVQPGDREPQEGDAPGAGRQDSGWQSPLRQRLSRIADDNAKYAGKTPTQIAYLKKLESYERQQAASQEEDSEG
jgi:hypothetical protein